MREKTRKLNKKEFENFKNKINSFKYKIDKAINNFQMNVAIAQFYEAYKYFTEAININIDNGNLKENFKDIIKLMIPFTPHIANECLYKLKCIDTNKWPDIDNKALENLEINMVVQVNGKTRDVLNISRNLSEKELDKIIRNKSKANKHIVDKKVLKTIYIKNKIINYIVK